MEAFDRDLTATLKAFPIFKLAGPASPDQRAEPAFTSLSAGQKLAPADTEAALLGPEFLAQPLPGEAEVLCRRLGIPQVSHTSFLTEHIFPRQVMHRPSQCLLMSLSTALYAEDFNNCISWNTRASSSRGCEPHIPSHLNF